VEKQTLYVATIGVFLGHSLDPPGYDAYETNGNWENPLVHR